MYPSPARASTQLSGFRSWKVWADSRSISTKVFFIFPFFWLFIHNAASSHIIKILTKKIHQQVSKINFTFSYKKTMIYLNINNGPSKIVFIKLNNCFFIINIKQFISTPSKCALIQSTRAGQRGERSHGGCHITSRMHPAIRGQFQYDDHLSMYRSSHWDGPPNTSQVILRSI